MPNTPKILAFAGSGRTNSYNKMLLKIAAQGAEESGVEVTFFDFKDHPMAIYDGDFADQHYFDANAKLFKQALREHQGLLIASPEFNNSLSGILKNALDWATIPEDEERPYDVFRGKVAGLLSTSPGSMGGIRGLEHLRSILANIQVMVLPEQFVVPFSSRAFNEEGILVNEQQQSRAKNIGKRLAEIVQKLHS